MDLRSPLVGPLRGLDYLSGGRMERLSDTGVRVHPVRAAVNGVLVDVASATDLTGLSLAADSGIYCYVSDQGVVTQSTQAPEVDPTVDAAPSVWRYTGDSTRRCLGYWPTDSTGALFPGRATTAGRRRELLLLYRGASNDTRIISAALSEADWSMASAGALVPVWADTLVVASKPRDGHFIAALSPADPGVGVLASKGTQTYQMPLASGDAAQLGPSRVPYDPAVGLYWRTLTLSGTPALNLDVSGFGGNL